MIRGTGSSHLVRVVMSVVVLSALAEGGARRLTTASTPVDEFPRGVGRVTVQAGPLTLQVGSHRGGQLFHIVDQLSDWSLYCQPAVQAPSRALFRRGRGTAAKARCHQESASWL